MATIPQSRLKNDVVPKDQVLMAKAIHDSLHDELGKIVQKSIETDVQEKTAIMVGKALSKELEDVVSRVKALYEYRIAHLESEIKRLTETNERAHQLSIEQDHKLEHMKSYYEGKIDSIHNSMKLEMEHVKSVIQAIPAPVIKFPEKAIHVDVPQTIVNLPEKAIHVTQGNVVVPKEAIRVEVGTPTITVPKDAVKVELSHEKRKQVVEKSIVYDQKSGRPKSIIETLRDE